MTIASPRRRERVLSGLHPGVFEFIEQEACKSEMAHATCRGTWVAARPGMLRNLSLLGLVATAACANSSDLASLANRKVSLAVGNGVDVWLANDGVENDCFALDSVAATFNGDV